MLHMGGMGLGWMRMEMQNTQGPGQPLCWDKGDFNSPVRAEQPIPALSRIKGLTNRFMPLAGGSAFLQPLSPLHCLHSFFSFTYFYGKGTRGGS